MRGYSCVTQRFNDLAKVGSHVLKDQREADHVRLIVADALKNLVGIRTISHDGRLVARGVHGRHQITQSEIVLILETDQQDLLCAARRLAHGYLHWQGWKFSHHWPPFLEKLLWPQEAQKAQNRFLQFFELLCLLWQTFAQRYCQAIAGLAVSSGFLFAC